MGELTLVFVRNKETVDWVDIEVAIVGFQACSVHLLDRAFDSLNGVKRAVGREL